MYAVTNSPHPQVLRWVEQGLLTSEQSILLHDRARQLDDEYDPYDSEPVPESIWREHQDVEEVWLVNVYSVTREYGGPEEGGWYYDAYRPTGEILAHPFTDKDEAYEVAGHMDAFLGIRNRAQAYPYTSVLGNDELRTRVESHVPREPGTPRYC